MTDKKFTDEFIIKEFEHLIDCTSKDELISNNGVTQGDLLDLINRQQAEIDIQKVHLKRVCAERDARICTNNFIKSEAYKEFAARLKCGVPQETGVIRCSDIDNLVKEMVGEEE